GVQTCALPIYALKGFPSQEIKLKTQKGVAVCQKVDIFKEMMWYAYEGEWANWYVLTTDQVKEIIDLDKNKQTAASLEDYAVDLTEDTKTSFENVVGQDSLTRFDRPKGKKKRPQNKKRPANNKASQANGKTNQGTDKSSQTSKKAKQPNNRAAQTNNKDGQGPTKSNQSNNKSKRPKNAK